MRLYWIRRPYIHWLVSFKDRERFKYRLRERYRKATAGTRDAKHTQSSQVQLEAQGREFFLPQVTEALSTIRFGCSSLKNLKRIIYSSF